MSNVTINFSPAWFIGEKKKEKVSNRRRNNFFEKDIGYYSNSKQVSYSLLDSPRISLFHFKSGTSSIQCHVSLCEIRGVKDNLGQIILLSFFFSFFGKEEAAKLRNGNSGRTRSGGEREREANI